MRPEQAAERRSREMTRYLISVPSGAMDHIPAEEFPAVGEAAHAVVQEAMDAGVWVFGGGLAEDVNPVMVAGDGTITAGTYAQTKEFNGGFTVLDLPSREAALEGPRRSRPPAAVLKRSASSCPTRRWATERSPTWPIRARGRNITHRLRERPATRRGRGCSFSAAAGVALPEPHRDCQPRLRDPPRVRRPGPR